MNYVELLAKELYEQQNAPNLWENVGQDYPYMPMRNQWMRHAQKLCDEGLDIIDSYVLPRRLQDVQRGLDETANKPSLEERVARLERYLGMQYWYAN